MSNQEFTATRTMLANAFATAGAELLEYMGVSSALAAIPNTEPPQYVVAGTLQMIAKALPPVSAVEQPTGDLTDEQIEQIFAPMMPWLPSKHGLQQFARAIERAAIGRYIARQLTGGLPPLPSNKLATTYNAEEMHDYARAAIAAYLARQAQAEPIPDILFDGKAVYDEITRHLGRAHCFAADAVSATLDAVVRLMHRGAPVAPAGAQNALPEGCAIDAQGAVYYDVVETYYQAECAEAMHMWLDDQGTPRADDEGKAFSLVGRVARLVEANAQNATKEAKQGSLHISKDVARSIQSALDLAMTICDAVPTRAHDLAEDCDLKHIGALVNYNEPTGFHGYAVIRDAKGMFSSALAATTATDTGAQNAQPELTVWEGAMPESNGKSNFTAVLHRKDSEGFDIFTDGFQFARSEYPDRVRYEADFMRWLIGEREVKPELWDDCYDMDKHSGYVAPSKPSAGAQNAEAIRNQAADSEHEVIVDRRDLFDALRAAHREGQSVGQLEGAESWHKATEYADAEIKGWKTMRVLQTGSANTQEGGDDA
jgi:hypothetical protein